MRVFPIQALPGDPDTQKWRRSVEDRVIELETSLQSLSSSVTNTLSGLNGTLDRLTGVTQSLNATVTRLNESIEEFSHSVSFSTTGGDRWVDSNLAITPPLWATQATLLFSEATIVSTSFPGTSFTRVEWHFNGEELEFPNQAFVFTNPRIDNQTGIVTNSAPMVKTTAISDEVFIRPWVEIFPVSVSGTADLFINFTIKWSN